MNQQIEKIKDFITGELAVVGRDLTKAEQYLVDLFHLHHGPAGVLPPSPGIVPASSEPLPHDQSAA